ncbi:MAG: tetratricopeptide repeat protein [Massilia sp.]|nr:tetratricopeptide repeat protein [Massilia sp.]
MHASIKYLSSACLSALLFGCADHPRLRALPNAPTAPAGSADDAYLLGRQQHMAERYGAAIDSYQAALRINPRHVNASNGLATLDAQRGDLVQAIARWRALTSGAQAPSGPASAFLYSNLGYAHLLNGEYTQAITALNRACELDPSNHRPWHHLGSAFEKLGQFERAQRMRQHASTLEQRDIKGQTALAPALPGTASGAAAPDGWAATEVLQTSNGMYELRRSAPMAATTVTPAAGTSALTAIVTAPPAPFARVTLEIRNGNGITGMARSVARQMSDASLRVIRLSNDKRFDVAHTRVEYQGAFRQAAERLAGRFGNVAVMEVENSNGADVRLVMGRDLFPSKIEPRRISYAAPARPVTPT